MLKRKKKICKGPCGKETYIFSHGMCAKCAYKSNPKKISAISKKTQKENKSYTILRKLFLDANPECACGGKINGCDGMATTVHHKRGRIGSLYLDVKHWAGLTMSCHMWVETHPLEAKAMGLSESRLQNDDNSENSGDD